MEDLRHNKIDDLDRRYSTDTTILLKALSLFLPSDRQPELLLLIKFMEMRQILQWIQKPHDHCEPMGPDDYEQVFAMIRPSLSEATAQKIEQLINMASMFRMYQQMKDLMEVLGPLSADNGFQNHSDTDPASDKDHPEDNPKQNSPNSSANAGMMEMLKNMIPPENQAMVEMLMQMNS
ncbi:MAG: hypothetical protein K2J95_11315 [Lachnospiraceae bacterium]|nr:hypothetical protein [Lachnospiraceae bacterium]